MHLLQNLEMLALHGKKTYAGMIKLKIMILRDSSDFSIETQCAHRVPYKWRVER